MLEPMSNPSGTYPELVFKSSFTKSASVSGSSVTTSELLSKLSLTKADQIALIQSSFSGRHSLASWSSAPNFRRFLLFPAGILAALFPISPLYLPGFQVLR
jgi:hypothetical protein